MTPLRENSRIYSVGRKKDFMQSELNNQVQNQLDLTLNFKLSFDFWQIQ